MDGLNVKKFYSILDAMREIKQRSSEIESGSFTHIYLMYNDWDEIYYVSDDKFDLEKVIDYSFEGDMDIDEHAECFYVHKYFHEWEKESWPILHRNSKRTSFKGVLRERVYVSGEVSVSFSID